MSEQMSDIKSWNVGCCAGEWRGGLGSIREVAFKERGEANEWELTRKDRRLLDSSENRRAMEAVNM
jgi:hypothetical protein